MIRECHCNCCQEWRIKYRSLAEQRGNEDSGCIVYRVDLNNQIEWKEVVADFQTELICNMLTIKEGNQNRTAVALGMNRTTFRERMRALGIYWEDGEARIKI